jgi:hypothetical protein
MCGTGLEGKVGSLEVETPSRQPRGEVKLTDGCVSLSLGNSGPDINDDLVRCYLKS